MHKHHLIQVVALQAMLATSSHIKNVPGAPSASRRSFDRLIFIENGNLPPLLLSRLSQKRARARQTHRHKRGKR